MLRLVNVVNICCRRLSNAPSGNMVEFLKDRKLIRVSGCESRDLLQGLITNDIRHLDRSIGSMYAMFLNNKGRVLYDVIFYKTEDNDAFLLECDRGASQALQKHLKIYKLRRKVDIVEENDFNVFAVFNPASVIHRKQMNKENLEGLIVPCNLLNNMLPDDSSMSYENLIIFKDPRIGTLGSRIIAPKSCDVVSKISKVLPVEQKPDPNHTYKWFRYSFGIGEGIKDLPPGESFPLEANCDYLHGVSFHKGCYIGQELTARTHHTGVVRKRYMPLFFTKIPTESSQERSIEHENKKLGKLRGIENNVGLALLRIADALKPDEFNVGNGKARTEKPIWWPLEAPKEKITMMKSD